MPKASRKLLLDNVANLGSLSQAQRDRIVSDLKAYDFPTAKGDKWRDAMVTAVGKRDSVAARTLSIDINDGSVTLKACP
jgi:hypothetical protein